MTESCLNAVTNTNLNATNGQLELSRCDGAGTYPNDLKVQEERRVQWNLHTLKMLHHFRVQACVQSECIRRGGGGASSGGGDTGKGVGRRHLDGRGWGEW